MPRPYGWLNRFLLSAEVRGSFFDFDFQRGQLNIPASLIDGEGADLSEHYVFEYVDITPYWKSETRRKFRSKEKFARRLGLEFYSLNGQTNHSRLLVGKIVGKTDGRGSVEHDGPIIALKFPADAENTICGNSEDPLYPSRGYVARLFDGYELDPGYAPNLADLTVGMGGKLVAVEGKGKLDARLFWQTVVFFEGGYSAVLYNTPSPAVGGAFRTITHLGPKEARLSELFEGIAMYANMLGGRVRAFHPENDFIVLVNTYREDDLRELERDLETHRVVGYLDVRAIS